MPAYPEDSLDGISLAVAEVDPPGDGDDLGSTMLRKQPLHWPIRIRTLQHQQLRRLPHFIA